MHQSKFGFIYCLVNVITEWLEVAHQQVHNQSIAYIQRIEMKKNPKFYGKQYFFKYTF